MSRAFRCPVCGAGEFRAVFAPRPNGEKRPTFLHECGGCSTVFLDPLAFSANEPGPPRSRGVQELPVPPDGFPVPGKR